MWLCVHKPQPAAPDKGCPMVSPAQSQCQHSYVACRLSCRYCCAHAVGDVPLKPSRGQQVATAGFVCRPSAGPPRQLHKPELSLKQAWGELNTKQGCRPVLWKLQYSVGALWLYSSAVTPQYTQHGGSTCWALWLMGGFAAMLGPRQCPSCGLGFLQHTVQSEKLWRQPLGRGGHSMLVLYVPAPPFTSEPHEPLSCTQVRLQCLADLTSTSCSPISLVLQAHDVAQRQHAMYPAQ